MGCVSSTSDGVGANQPKSKGSDRELPKEFNAEEFADILNEAIKSGNTELCMKCVQDIVPSDRKILAETYATKYNTTIIEKCKEKKLGKVDLAIRLLLQQQALNKAQHLNMCLSKVTTDQMYQDLIVIILTDDSQVQEVNEEYKKQYGVDLVDDLDKCSESAKDILKAFVKPDRDMDTGTVENATTSLIEAAGKNTLFQDEKVFYKVVESKPMNDLQDILESYLKRCQKDFIVEIEKYFEEGQGRSTLVTLVSIIRNRKLYLSEKISEWMKKSDGLYQEALLFTVLVQSDEQLQDLKVVYKSACLEPMARDVKAEVKDPLIQRVLLKAVK